MINSLIKRFKENIADSEPIMGSYAIFMLVAHPSFYALNLYLLAPQSYSNLSIRLITCLLALIVVLKEHLPVRYIAYVPLIWYTMLVLSVPFFGTFMLLNNNFSFAWVLNSLSLFILMMFLVDWMSYFILLMLGILVAFLFYSLITPNPLSFSMDITPVTPLDIILTFLVSLIMGMIFSRKRGLVEREKLKAMQAVAASVAHELRTPLAAIRLGTEGINNYLPKLLEGFELARQNNLPVPTLRANYYSILSQALSDIKLEVISSNNVIDMLLLKVNTNFKYHEFQACSMKECLEEALRRYPFDELSEEQQLVHCDINPDFMFKGEKLLMIHVFFNLIKNALFFIQDAQKGEIYIWTETAKNKNTLYFKDTAKGMSKEAAENAFKKFFTTTYNGTGLGLAFCKTVIEQCGGQITCTSQWGEFTQFALSFPPYSDN